MARIIFPTSLYWPLDAPPSPSIQWVPGHRTSRRGTVGWNPRVHSARHPQRSTGRVTWWFFGTFETFDCYGSCGYRSTWCTVLNHIEPVPLMQGCKTPPTSILINRLPLTCKGPASQLASQPVNGLSKIAIPNPMFHQNPSCSTSKLQFNCSKSNISAWQPIVLLSKYDFWHLNSYFLLIKSC
jgi:hypothetical protein